MLGHKLLEMTLAYVHIADHETYQAATLNDMLEGKAKGI